MYRFYLQQWKIINLQTCKKMTQNEDSTFSCRVDCAGGAHFRQRKYRISLAVVADVAGITTPCIFPSTLSLRCCRNGLISRERSAPSL